MLDQFIILHRELHNGGGLQNTLLHDCLSVSII